MVLKHCKNKSKTSQIACEEKIRVAKFRALNNLGEADFKALTQNFGKYFHRFATDFFRIKFSFFGEKLTPAKFLNENMESVTPDLTCSYLWYICIWPISSCAECAKQKPFTPKPEAREVLEWLKENSPIVHSPCPPKEVLLICSPGESIIAKQKKKYGLTWWRGKGSPLLVSQHFHSALELILVKKNQHSPKVSVLNKDI